MSAPSQAQVARVEFQTFGALRLEAPPGATRELVEEVCAINGRRRVLALLSVLALTDGPLSRDVLCDFFWGDSDPVRSRHSLTEAVSALRVLLGKAAFGFRAKDLRLAADAPIRVDAREFLLATNTGQHELACALYRSDFLEGVHVERAARFEQWADGVRASLRARFLLSLPEAIAAMAARDDHASAAQLAERWVRADPFDEKAWLTWLRMSAAPGTTKAYRDTLDAYQRAANWMRDEFDEAPDSSVQRYLAELESAAVADGPSPAFTAAPNQREAAPALAQIETPAEQAPRRNGRSVRSWWWRTPLAASALGIVGLITWRAGIIGTRFDGALRGTPDEPVAVLVADAEFSRGDSSLAAGLTLAVRTALGDAPSVQVHSATTVRELARLAAGTTVVDTTVMPPISEGLALELAQRAGTGVVLVPVVVRVGSQITLALRVVRAADGGGILTVRSAVVDSAHVLPALDALVRRVQQRLDASRPTLAATRPLPRVTTGSLPALEVYAGGLRLWDAGRPQEASLAFERALRIDPAFASARAMLASAEAFSNRPQRADTLFREALRVAERLSPRERMLLDASYARWQGRPDSAVAIRTRWIEAHPFDEEIEAVNAYDLFRARQFEAARVAYARLVQRRPWDASLFINYGLVLARIDSVPPPRAVSIYAQGLALEPTRTAHPFFTGDYGGLLIRAGMFDSAVSVFRRHRGATASLRGRSQRSEGMLALFRDRPRDAVSPLIAAIAASDTAGEPLSRVRSRLLLEYALARAGDSLGAGVQRDTLVREYGDVQEPTVLFWVGQRLARAGRVIDARRVLDTLRQRLVPGNRTHESVLWLLEGELATAAGHPAEGAKATERGLALDSFAVNVESHAYTLARAGRSEEARPLLQGLARQRREFGFEPVVAQQRARAALTALDRRTGNEVIH